MRDRQAEGGGRRSHKAGVRRALRTRGLTLELVFHPEALAFDDDGVGMMQQPIENCRGQGAVVVEDRGPLLEGAVRGNDQRPLFIAEADHLEEQIGTHLVDREIAELVQDQQRGFRVFFELHGLLTAFPKMDIRSAQELL